MEDNKKVAIFHCDNLVLGLDDIATNIESVLKLPVEKHCLAISEMGKVVESLREEQFKLTALVLHAEETRLSVNEPHAAIGYTALYRRLRSVSGMGGV